MITPQDEIQQLLYERRLLVFVAVTCGLGVVAWFVAMFTDYWIVMVAVQEGGIPILSSNGTNNFLWSHTGLWRSCLIYSVKDSELQETRCRYHQYGSSNELASFMQAELSICVVVLVLITLSAFFSVYSLINPRYTFKRITGFLHLMTAISVLILNQTVQSESHITQHALHIGQGPADQEALKTATILYGFSYLLAWIVCLIFFGASVAFFMGSRKRKLLPFDHDQFIK